MKSSSVCEQDALVKEMIASMGSERDWNRVASNFPGRDVDQCIQRWNKLMPKNRKGAGPEGEVVKGPWRKDEDEKVIELVTKFGPRKWSVIAGYLPGRIGKQCRERWHNHLNPEITKTAWTEEEDNIIMNVRTTTEEQPLVV
jgi:hypothetical protein